MKVKRNNAVIRGVIFDMDGVLCDSEPFICEAARQMFRENYGLDVKPGEFIPFVGTGEDRFLGGPAEKHGRKLNLPVDKARTYAIYLEIIRGRLKPLAGVTEFIGECRRKKIKMAVASSADSVKVNGNLAEIQLPPESFDACISGEEVVNKKPDPAIFLLAAGRLALPADKCLVIEDALNGVKAAVAAGMRVLALTTSFSAAALRSAGADWTAADLAHLPPLPLPE